MRIEETTLSLVLVLEDMVPLYQQLLGLLMREREVIVGDDVDGLTRNLNEKGSLLGRIGQLDRKRSEAVVVLSRALGGSEGQLSLRQLVERVPAHCRNRLMSCQYALEGLIRGIASTNQVNGVVIDRSLQRVGGLLNLVRRYVPMASSYRKDGLPEGMGQIRRTLAKG